MRKITIAIILFVLLTCIAGCATDTEKEFLVLKQISCPYQIKQIYMENTYKGWAVSTENEVLITDNGIEGFTVIKTIEGINPATDEFVNAAFLGEETAYMAYFSEDNRNLVVEYTKDRGRSWQQTIVQYADFTNGSDMGNVYISFADKENGYLLYCSTPAAGMMTKLLFCTEDAGKTYSYVEDLTGEIKGYPEGITFTSKEKGYIAVAYHGEDDYLYRTEDGAGTWTSEELFYKDNNINYVDGCAPVFYGEDMKKGILVCKLAGEQAVYKLLVTEDGGCNWMQEGGLPLESVAGYQACDENQLYFIDDNGNVYQKIDFHE